MSSVRIEHASCHYAGTEGAGITDVDLDIASGELVTFVGEVGSGRSTLLRMVADKIDALLATLGGQTALNTAMSLAKAGILEIGDVFVVNKADRADADATVRDLRHMVGLADRRAPNLWRPVVVKASAATGAGIEEVLAATAKHHDWARSSGELRVRRIRRAAAEVEALALTRLRARLGDLRAGSALGEAAVAVVDGRQDPFTAADRLLAAIR